MPPKSKRRSSANKGDNRSKGEEEDMNLGGGGGGGDFVSTTAVTRNQNDDEQNHNNGDGDANIGAGGDSINANYFNGERSFTENGVISTPEDTSSSSSLTQVTGGSTLLMDHEEGDATDEEDNEVVVSASLNLGQNSQLELKTKEEVKSTSPSPQRKVGSPRPNLEAQKTPSSSEKTMSAQVSSSSPSSSSYTTASASTVNSSLNSSTVSAPPDLNCTAGREEIPEPEQVPVLPPTVTTLSINNAKIYLIGTAHFSTQSQEDVRTVVKMTQPDCILLELCQSRRNILHLDEEMLLKEAGDISLAKITATLRNAPPNSSRVQSLLHLLLLSMSASLTKKLGMAPGGEFRAAVQEADKLTKKTTLLLGDRPFNVTMARAIASLSFMQKAKLAWQFLISSDDITKEEIEKCKERDLLEKMLSEMTGEFPSITEVFVNERDYYLAHTLFMSSKAIAEAKEGQGINEAVVVAVVGMGHVPGICKNFGSTNEQEFDRVGSLPPVAPPSTTQWLIKTTVKLTLYGIVGYGAYKLFNRIDVFKKFENGFKIGVIKIKQ